uniref:Uncharacterized protein n=1 Tax=Anguilla anguilla TaxID=7936 RepID=A0A0E9RSK6_ANGAN
MSSFYVSFTNRTLTSIQKHLLADKCFCMWVCMQGCHVYLGKSYKSVINTSISINNTTLLFCCC